MSGSDSRFPISGTLGFIGGGNMARSMIGGLLARGQPAASIRVSEPNADARSALEREYGIATATDNAGTAAAADLLVLAVKPQVMRAVCEDIAPARRADALVLSIAAGITVAQLESWLGDRSAIVRCMPNTPALIGEGASGLFASPQCSAPQRAAAEILMSATGCAVWIEEEPLMDAVTAVSGSGPAYFFHLLEALQAAAERQGLPATTARRLVVQTALGAARMAADSDEDAAALRRRVTSPGGTTERALEVLTEGGFVALIDRAVTAATERGRALSADAGA